MPPFRIYRRGCEQMEMTDPDCRQAGTVNTEGYTEEMQRPAFAKLMLRCKRSITIRLFLFIEHYGELGIVKVARKLLSRIRYVWLSGEPYQTSVVK